MTWIYRNLLSFRQIILRFVIHTAAIQRYGKRVVIDCPVICFQLKCNRTIPEISKIRFLAHFCICAALLKVPVRVKERDIACFFLIIPEKYCSNTVTGMIRN